MSSVEKSIYGDMSLAEAFPDVDPGVRPLGQRVLVQFKWVPKKTMSGIHIPDESRDTEKWNTSVAKVVSIGPLAYRKRDTMEPWPEGAWAKVGDFVRAPRYGGDRWEVRINPDSDSDYEAVVFAMFNDHELIGHVYADPRTIRAYV